MLCQTSPHGIRQYWTCRMEREGRAYVSSGDGVWNGRDGVWNGGHGVWNAKRAPPLCWLHDLTVHELVGLALT
eukprot:533583-Rhodomonas_salina.1